MRTIEQARDFIVNRFRKSYEENNFGLYSIELKENHVIIGICGFVKRDSLPDADIGFALLPQYEKKGYAFEAASATLKYGREVLGLKRVLAITTLDNESSGKLLEKINLNFERLITLNGETEKVKLFSTNF